jgi:hypothetical protein
MRIFLIVLFVTGAVGISTSLFAASYQELRDRALENCTTIDPGEYQTGLALNPEGYRSYYQKSACMQRAAVKFRDESLCKQVRRRYALFSSSWGYSKKNCLNLVAETEAKDRHELAALRQQYSEGPVKLVDLQLEANGNGRDFDFVPHFADGFTHAYHLSLFLVEKNGDSYPILEYGSYLQGSEDNIRLYVTRADLLKHFPGLQFGHPYTLEAKLKLSIAMGRQGGWYREDIIEDIFPQSVRTQIFTSTVTF